jgi:hypothetical protein
MKPEMVIWDALRGALVTRALGLSADLRVAQALAAGPRSHVTLAREQGVDPDVLYRVLRASRARASSRRPSQASSATRPPLSC